ncbi:hypothetical protein JVT61DRAFT_13349 [Boletus reticuloceps]|uniref:HTH APSES-type domain-containing protein n=1 Tax=Boletus reticuloceps TaxID=495285 RepID=A0A8I2YDE5_9AGAM|nr:hypothetical protein JVT61DRAFT_13349 [Boletus reticuloceps]
MDSSSSSSPPSTTTTGTRFRPYASPHHQVTKGRYITSNDPRGYIPVYEYPLNGQWIMMDIDDGYILWTGIWKGTSLPPPFSADIVKMIDSQPDLAPVIRRVRGGYLKIQGTWMPYEVSAPTAMPVAWPIRDDLVPLFGPTFPSTCLSPDQPGYGQVVSTASGRRRPRRSNQSAAPISSTSLSQPPWSSTIPVLPGPVEHAPLYHRSDQDTSPHIYNTLYSYPPPRQLTDARVISPMQRGRQPSPPSTSPLVRERSLRSRYSPYPSSVVTQRKASIESVSFGIPSISLHDPSDPRSGNRLPGDEIKLPPIQSLAPPRHGSNPSYALPPISALEDLRGVSSQDSATVLERLKMDDTKSDTDDVCWARHRSFSMSARPTHSFPTPASWSSDSTRARAHCEPANVSSREFSPTQYSPHEGSSAGAISPASPATPRSTEAHIPALKSRVTRMDGPGQVPFVTDHSDYRMPAHHLGTADYYRKNTARSAGPDMRLSVRHATDSDESEVEHTSIKRPMRPW